MYIGARQSVQMGRLYDKGVEQKVSQSGRWWRWEVEYKAESASSVAEALRKVDEPEVLIYSVVASWFRSRSMNMPGRAAEFIIWNEQRAPTSTERQLSWLARGVRPTVLDLIDRVGLERVLQALGLPPQSAVNQPHLRETA